MSSSSHPNFSSANPGCLLPCGVDCRYAVPLSSGDGDWFWCTSPAMTAQLMQAGHECANFATRPPLP